MIPRQPNSQDARSLPDEYARLHSPAAPRILELVARRWGDRQEGERRQLAQVLVTILEPLNRPDGKVTDDLRNACEQAVATWVQKTVPVRDLVPASTAVAEPDGGRRLIRLANAQIATEDDGHSWARVTLERAGGGLYPAKNRCKPDQVTDQLRAAAEATVQSLRQALGGDVRLEVREVGTFGAFQTTGVIVAVAVSQEGQQWTGVGVCPDMRNDPVRAAAVAVLNATNRRLGIG
jgi:LeuA-like protein with dimerisation domain